jgi:hypothetical protein
MQMILETGGIVKYRETSLSGNAEKHPNFMALALK